MLKKAVALFLAGAGLALCVSCAKTTSHFVYAAIPTSSEILAYREDPNSGALTPLAVSPISAGQGVTSIAIHPSAKFLYASNSSENNISRFVIASNGVLTEITPRMNTTGTTPTVLAMDPAGNYLYVANSESNNISVFTIDINNQGALTAFGNPTQIGLSPLNMVLSPNGNFVYVTGQSGSQGYVEVFSLSSLATQSQLPLVQAVLTGTNPFGLAIDPGGKNLYTANFSTASISEFSIDASTGALTELSGSPFGETYTSPVALLVDSSGKYLYVANQGSANLAAYSIGSSGGLTLLSGSPFVSNAQPSVIATDPDGQYLFVGNQKSSAIESFSLSTGSGTLSEVGSYPVANSPTSIVVLK